VRRLIPAVLALALVTAACSGGGDEIARVGETSITTSSLETLYDGDSLPIDGEFRDALFRIMAVEVLEQGMEEDFGLTVDEDEVTTRFQEQMADIELSGGSVGDAIGIPNATAEMVRFDARISVLIDQVVERLTGDPSFLQEFYDMGSTITEVCVRHILAPTEEVATDTKQLLDEGADWEEMVGSVSIDTSSENGDLGCRPAATYVEPFANATMEAPVGELYGPVESEFGWHLLIVDSRTKPTLEEVLASPNDYISAEVAQQEFGIWLNEKLQAADAEVDPKIGTWSPVGIVPPETPDTEE